MLTHIVSKLYIDLDVCLPSLLFWLLSLSFLIYFPHSTLFKFVKDWAAWLFTKMRYHSVFILTQWDFKRLTFKPWISCTLFSQHLDKILPLLSKTVGALWVLLKVMTGSTPSLGFYHRIHHHHHYHHYLSSLFIWSCVRYSAKCLTCIMSLQPHHNLMKEVLVLVLFYRWENWRSRE